MNAKKAKAVRKLAQAQADVQQARIDAVWETRSLWRRFLDRINKVEKPVVDRRATYNRMKEYFK